MYLLLRILNWGPTTGFGLELGRIIFNLELIKGAGELFIPIMGPRIR